MNRIFWALILLLACQAPASAAFRYGLARSAGKRAAQVMDEAMPSHPAMVLPISSLESVTTGQVIWPFGVRSTSHPNGHPGLDFLPIIGASVYACATASVEQVQDDFSDGSQQKMIKLETRGYQIFYIGSIVNLTVSVGDVVKKGQKIGEFAQSTLWQNIRAVGFLHWGINPKGAGNSFGTDLCPYTVLERPHQLELERLFALSTYDDQSTYPLICNPCPAGGCR